MAKRARKNASDGLDKIEIVNPSDSDVWTRTHLYLMWFGAYGDGRVLVWADSFDSAFETAVDYFDDPKSCGVFTFTDEGDYKAAAKDEGIEWPAGGWDDLSEREQEKIREAAEADLTVIGHTTLSCMPKGAWGAFVASWEWGGDDITGDDLKFIRAKSLSIATADEMSSMRGSKKWRKAGQGQWTRPLDVDGPVCDATIYDQAAVFAAKGGDGRKLRVDIECNGATVESADVLSAEDAEDFVCDVEDRMIQEAEEDE